MGFDINSNIATPSGLSVDQINALLINTGLAGLGRSFHDNEAKHNINAYFMIAHAAIESAWGTSFYARNRNNLFGFNAVDSNPNNASYYPTKAAAVDYYAQFLHTYYLTPGAVYYNGTTPHGVFVKYSSSHDSEAQSVVGIMNDLAAKEGAVPPIPDTPIAPTPANVYTVVSGDNLSKIATAHGLTLAQLLSLNPKFQANPNLIFPGQTVSLGGAAPSVTPRTYTVASGDTLWAIASKHGMSLAQLEAKNPQIANPNLIHPGQIINL